MNKTNSPRNTTMWLWILKNVILSILLIIGSQYLVKYLKDTFTVRKIKTTDSQIEQYKTMLNEFQEQINKQQQISATIQRETLSKNDMNTLEEDLSDFLNQIST